MKLPVATHPWAAAMLLAIWHADFSTAAVTVFLDFNVQWSANLAQAAASAGATPFDASEQSLIETNILQQFMTEVAPFDVTFTTTDPGGPRERVDYGAMTSATNLLGQSTVNFLNTAPSTASVFTANFGFILESFEPRATQIDEISMALAGTGLHELGHSFGMRHHAAYGDPRITPANYDNTLSIQNEHLLATGSTGLSEEERETPRSFSQWSTVLMEAAVNLTANPLSLSIEAGDAGDTPASAMALETTPLAISQTEAALVFGQLSDQSDVDVFAFDVQQPRQLTAEIYAQGLFAFLDDFDSQLRVYDADGATILGSNDNIRFDGNLFAAGTIHETDSFLLNVPLPSAGTYFLEVSSNGPVTDPDGGGVYELIFATSEMVPEPIHVAWWWGLAWLAIRRKPSDSGKRI